jgi:hypothetical protein
LKNIVDYRLRRAAGGSHNLPSIKDGVKERVESANVIEQQKIQGS